MYGTQTGSWEKITQKMFENDVKMYGTQTVTETPSFDRLFENDVKMYGTQTMQKSLNTQNCLRMM